MLPITIWAVVRWLHLLAAMVWVGGMLFLLLVLLPVVRRELAPQERTLLVARVGQRFERVSLLALLVLVVTGILNAERRNVQWGRLSEYAWGQTLHTKLEILGVVIVLTLVHTRYYGRRLERLAERAARGEVTGEALAREQRRLRIGSGVLSALNLLLTLAIVLLAASLVA